MTPSEGAWAAALADLPGMGPATLVAAVGRDGPRAAWDRVRRGQLTRPERRRAAAAGQTTLDTGMAGTLAEPGGGRGRSWAALAASVDPVEAWAPFAASGVQVAWPGSPGYPEVLAGYPDPPGVLFWRGSLADLGRPCVALVGTRNATPDGRSVAFELGRDLVRAGVCVVSGLALGIDAAAHSGALEGRRTGAVGGGPGDGVAGTVGVAASGVDVPYPRRHARLWEEVIRAGAVVSETPPGRPAQAWRFPMRNRIIAGLVQMVVVVESHARGGSLITAEAALERGVDVRVVPGPVHSPASAGSNQLLYDGPGPVRHARDVLDGLGMLSDSVPEGSGSPRASGRPPAGPSGGRTPDRPLEPGDREVLDAVGWKPTTLNRVAERAGAPIGATLRSLERLAAKGLLWEEQGWWTRRQ